MKSTILLGGMWLGRGQAGEPHSCSLCFEADEWLLASQEEIERVFAFSAFSHTKVYNPHY